MDLDVSTRAALKLAFLPPGLLLLILLVGWLFARRFFGRLLLFVGIALFYGLSTPIAVDWLASQLESIPAKNADELKRARADAILVFLAGASEDNPEWGGDDALSSTSLARLDYALSIHRETELPILLSGGSPRNKTRPVAELGSEWLQRRVGITPAAIDTASRDTWENAQQSRELLEQLGYARVILVTHASHMPRARLSARAAGLDVVPAPFGFIHTLPEYREAWALEDYLPKPGRLLDSYRVLHEIMGLLWYGFNLGAAET